jgi:Arc/MetJ-type ribon-helix-helix transcriptional regulator
MKTLSVKVPEALDRRLTAAIKRRGARKSVVVREALERYLDETQGAPTGSVLDLAGDLAGCVKQAPRDLSSNPRHLSGLGK